MTSESHHEMNHNLRYLLYAIVGVVAGAIGLALGVFLASGDNGGWGNAVYYSVVGIVAAPLATLSWATRRPQRSQILAGLSILGGFVASLAILFDLTEEHATILAAASRAPFAFACWIAIWGLWNAMALARLMLFKPTHTRRRLYRRRHDMRHKDRSAI